MTALSPEERKKRIERPRELLAEREHHETHGNCIEWNNLTLDLANTVPDLLDELSRREQEHQDAKFSIFEDGWACGWGDHVKALKARKNRKTFVHTENPYRPLP